MKIIIVGCGKVGTALTAQLSREDNLVTVIDTDSIVVRNVSNTYDVMGIVGNGASYQVLQEADIEHADLMIAVTKSDEMNLLCCVIAKQSVSAPAASAAQVLCCSGKSFGIPLLFPIFYA